MKRKNAVPPQSRWVGTCPECGKRRFLVRSDAKKAARFLYPHDSFSVYRCSGYFHFGHNSRKGPL